MDKLRQSEKNKIYTDIATIQKNVDRLEQANLNLLTSAIKDPDFITKSRAGNVQKINALKLQIDQLRIKLSSVESGEYDATMREEIAKNTKKADTKAKLTFKKKEEKKEKEVPKKVYNTPYYQPINKAEVEQKQYDRFLNVRPPEYVQKSLDSMPNNKGYIWNGVWFFGLQQSGNMYPLIMHERKYGSNDKLVHEIHEDRHDIFLRPGRDTGQLIDSYARGWSRK